MKITTLYRDGLITLETELDAMFGKEVIKGTVLTGGVLEGFFMWGLTPLDVERAGGVEQFVDLVIRKFNAEIESMYPTADDAPAIDPADVIEMVKVALAQLVFNTDKPTLRRP